MHLYCMSEVWAMQIYIKDPSKKNRTFSNLHIYQFDVKLLKTNGQNESHSLFHRTSRRDFSVETSLWRHGFLVPRMLRRRSSSRNLLSWVFGSVRMQCCHHYRWAINQTLLIAVKIHQLIANCCWNFGLQTCTSFLLFLLLFRGSPDLR